MDLILWKGKRYCFGVSKTVTTEDGGVVVVGHRVVISLGRRPWHKNQFIVNIVTSYIYTIGLSKALKSQLINMFYQYLDATCKQSATCLHLKLKRSPFFEFG